MPPGWSIAGTLTRTCLTTLVGLGLLIAATGVAEAGPSRGTAYAEWLSSSARPGQTVGLAIRTTDTLSAAGSSYPDGTFSVTYDKNVLDFVGHQNPGVCNTQPTVTSPEVTFVLNEYVACTEAYVGAGQTKWDTFYFTARTSPGAGTATVFAQANYGAVRSSGAQADLTLVGGDPRLAFTNGCTMAPDRIPRLIDIQDLCNMHDVSYARFPDGHHQYGSNEWGRFQADNAFLAAMVSRCNSTFAWYDRRRSTCTVAALVYYGAVRAFGAAFYYDNNTRF